MKKTRTIIVSIISLMFVVLTSVFASKAYAFWHFNPTINKEFTTNTKIDTIKENYQQGNEQFLDEVYTLYFFSQPQAANDINSAGTNFDINSYTPIKDESYGYWDEASGLTYRYSYKSITVKQALSQDLLDKVGEPSINIEGVSFTGWTAYIDTAMQVANGINSNPKTYLQDKFNFLDIMVNLYDYAHNTLVSNGQNLNGGIIDDHIIYVYPVYTNGININHEQEHGHASIRLENIAQNTYKYFDYTNEGGYQYWSFNNVNLSNKEINLNYHLQAHIPLTNEWFFIPGDTLNQNIGYFNIFVYFEFQTSSYISPGENMFNHVPAYVKAVNKYYFTSSTLSKELAKLDGSSQTYYYNYLIAFVPINEFRLLGGSSDTFDYFDASVPIFYPLKSVTYNGSTINNLYYASGVYFSDRSSTNMAQSTIYYEDQAYVIQHKQSGYGIANGRFIDNAVPVRNAKWSDIEDPNIAKYVSEEWGFDINTTTGSFNREGNWEFVGEGPSNYDENYFKSRFFTFSKTAHYGYNDIMLYVDTSQLNQDDPRDPPFTIYIAVRQSTATTPSFVKIIEEDQLNQVSYDNEGFINHTSFGSHLNQTGSPMMSYYFSTASTENSLYPNDPSVLTKYEGTITLKDKFFVHYDSSSGIKEVTSLEDIIKDNNSSYDLVDVSSNKVIVPHDASSNSFALSLYKSYVLYRRKVS